MKKAGLLRKANLLSNNFASDYGMVAEFILKDKSPFLSISKDRISDRTASPRFSVKVNTEYKAPVENLAFSAIVEKDISSVGKEMLGVTLLSMNNIVKLEQQNETVDAISEKIAREVIQEGSIAREDVERIFNEYRNLFKLAYKKFTENGVEAGANHVREYLVN